MKALLVPVYQLYLLQLENYELRRYWRLLPQRGYAFPKQPLRKTIKWTKKAIVFFALALLIYVILIGTALLVSSKLSAMLVCIIGFFLFPIFFTIIFFFLLPIDYVLKQFYIAKARRMLSLHNSVKVIGIAGSYGKTTMKNILSSVLSVKFNVITTPESVNTPIGISQWLIKTLTKQTEIAIIEMGEHYKGDIAHISSITPSDTAVVTGINEAHFERLESLDRSIATIFEIVDCAKSDAHIFLNADDECVKKNYTSYTKGKAVSFYSYRNDPLSKMKITSRTFDEEKLQWVFTTPSLGSVSVSLLGEYVIGDVIASVLIGQSLGMKKDELKKGIATISPIPHRLQPIEGAGGTLVIDDSYNGNSDGAKEAIRVLSRFKKRRKIYITPGLVETGEKKEAVHMQIGHELAGVADRVILIKNSVTPYIAKGLKEQKFDESHIIWFNTAGEAHKGLSDILKPNDVILFQNDWGDQYI